MVNHSKISTQDLFDEDMEEVNYQKKHNKFVVRERKQQKRKAKNDWGNWYE